jgi:enamine deaminase RidA (YjgF/YER057c/UK114 family)
MSHERRNAPGLPPPSGFSHLVRAGGLLFISGQIPLDASRTLVGPGDPAAQIRQVFTNLRLALEDAGASWTDVAMLNVYLTDMSHLEDLRAIRAEVYAAAGIEPPATTTVEVNRLARPEAMVEIEAIAVRGQ